MGTREARPVDEPSDPSEAPQQGEFRCGNEKGDHVARETDFARVANTVLRDFFDGLYFGIRMVIKY